MFKVTKLINKETGLGSHLVYLQYCTNIFLLSLWACSIWTTMQANLRKKKILEKLFKKSSLFPLESHISSIMLFSPLGSTKVSQNSPIMSAEIWCLHYICLGKFLILWHSAENTHYKSEAYRKFRNERDLLHTWGSESSFLNSCLKTKQKFVVLKTTHFLSSLRNLSVPFFCT